MRLTMKERKAVAAVTGARYQKASKKEKGNLLRQFTDLTGYCRRYGAWLLRQHGRKRRVGRTAIVGDMRKKTERKKREPIYGREVVEALTKIWMIMDCICGKRLKAGLSDVIPVLKRNMEMRLRRETEEKLLRISASTIDRLLGPERKKQELRGRSGTKPGSLLKYQIPIRTFSEWDESRPGFVEVDLVAHDGGDPSGDFCQTLDVTDVCTGWTETRAVRNKAQVWVFQALTEIREALPFQLLGLDSDNGSEFINHELFRYCSEEGITFTRSRPHRKNDNCFVEEKNYSVVRRNVGYRRYDTPEELEALNELYSYLRLYSNYFLPVMKLTRKERIGSKVKKIHDEPRTPLKRVLASPYVEERRKKRVRNIYAELNPAELKRNITRLQEKLVRLNTTKEKAKTAHSARPRSARTRVERKGRSKQRSARLH